MLKERREAAQAVASEFIKAEFAVDDAARFTATCLSTMLAQRAMAKLPIETGVKALRMVHDLSDDLLRLREKFIETHRALAAVRDEIGLARMFGDEIPCPSPSAVADQERPRLTIVA